MVILEAGAWDICQSEYVNQPIKQSIEETGTLWETPRTI